AHAGETDLVCWGPTGFGSADAISRVAQVANDDPGARIACTGKAGAHQAVEGMTVKVAARVAQVVADMFPTPMDAAAVRIERGFISNRCADLAPVRNVTGARVCLLALLASAAGHPAGADAAIDKRAALRTDRDGNTADIVGACAAGGVDGGADADCIRNRRLLAGNGGVAQDVCNSGTRTQAERS